MNNSGEGGNRKVYFLTMAIRDKLIALKGRTREHTTRINSLEYSPNGQVDTLSDEGTVYKVYKRRWFGVAIIMLLNIISSWRFRDPLNMLNTCADFSFLVGLHLRLSRDSRGTFFIFHQLVL